MTDETITYEGTISRELFASAQKLHGRKLLRILGLVMTSITVAMLLAFWVSSEEALLRGALVLAVFGLIGAPFLLVARQFQWRRLYERTPYLREPLRGVISRASFRVEGPTGRSDIPWSQFTKKVEAEDLVLLYLGPNLIHCVAREMFPSTVDWENAKSLIRDTAVFVDVSRVER